MDAKAEIQRGKRFHRVNDPCLRRRFNRAYRACETGCASPGRRSRTQFALGSLISPLWGCNAKARRRNKLGKRDGTSEGSAPTGRANEAIQRCEGSRLTVAGWKIRIKIRIMRGTHKGEMHPGRIPLADCACPERGLEAECVRALGDNARRRMGLLPAALFGPSRWSSVKHLRWRPQNTKGQEIMTSNQICL
jgi:hypothetical protein